MMRTIATDVVTLSVCVLGTTVVSVKRLGMKSHVGLRNH